MFTVPLMECLVCRGWYLAVASPDIEVVINRKARQHFKGHFGRLGRNPISLGMAEQFASDSHRLLFRKRSLVLFVHDRTPGVDLFVNVDLNRANI